VSAIGTEDFLKATNMPTPSGKSNTFPYDMVAIIRGQSKNALKIPCVHKMYGYFAKFAIFIPI
jgi:hypothetical protein